ncbi:MAG: DinB family protein [Saprospiraceae bacterium]
MKDYLQHLASFNLWANQKFCEQLINVSEDRLMKEITSSFPSIKKTVKHLLDAESAWWLRIHEPNIVIKFGDDYTGSFMKLVQELNATSKQWVNYVSSKSEAELALAFKYKRLDKEYESRIQDILIHLFNHGTYHRGQLVTMMRQIGIDYIPATDFIAYSREYM